jgi:hypothetical protein
MVARGGGVGRYWLYRLRGQSPVEQCDDLASLTCDLAVACIAGASGMHDACVRAFNQTMSCGTAKSVGPSYDRCMDQLDALSCQILFPRDQATGEHAVSAVLYATLAVMSCATTPDMADRAQVLC